MKSKAFAKPSRRFAAALPGKKQCLESRCPDANLRANVGRLAHPVPQQKGSSRNDIKLPLTSGQIPTYIQSPTLIDRHNLKTLTGRTLASVGVKRQAIG